MSVLILESCVNQRPHGFLKQAATQLLGHLDIVQQMSEEQTQKTSVPNCSFLHKHFHLAF